MQSNFLNLHDVILLLTAVECIFLAMLLRVIPSRQTQSHAILAAFFIIIAVNLVTIVIIWSEQLRYSAINQSSIVLSLLVTSILLKGPVLFFYLGSLSKSRNFYSWRNLIHLIPALVSVAIINFFNLNNLSWQHTASMGGIEKMAVSCVWTMTKLMPFVYVVASVVAEYKLRRDLKHLCSSVPTTELKMADVVLFGFCAHWLWSLLAYVFEGHFDIDVRDSMGIINNYLTVVLVNGLFVFGVLNKRELLGDIDISTAKPAPDMIFEPKIAAIENGIHQRKLFLESNINLERFSEQIGLKPRDTSIVINSHYQTTFLEFINYYRVEEAKRILALPEFKDESIQTIIDKSGFNSSSAFHRFFKRVVGITPTEFRKLAISAADKN